MIQIYFKPTCSTCRTALSIVKEETAEDIRLIEYMKEIPTQKDIKDVLKMLGLKAEEIVRKKEQLYKDKYQGKKISNAEWIRILSKNPVLIERPILIKDGKAIIGRPVERIKDFLK